MMSLQVTIKSVSEISVTLFDDSINSVKTEYYLDLTGKLWQICPPIIIVWGTIGKYEWCLSSFHIVEK